MEPTVAIARCADYGACRAAIEECMDASGLGDDLRDCRVFLKLNLMKGAAPEKRINTDPRFVGALTALLVERGCEVLAGDSSGVLGFTGEAMRASGVSEAVRRAGGRPMNLDAGPFALAPVEGKVFARFWLPRILSEVDRVISVPKLKTHTLTTMTGAVKNFVGALPGGSKCEIHTKAPSPAQVSEAILDLFMAVKPHGAVVDAVWGLAGQGKGVGPIPAKAGLVVAGRDCAAVDVVCAEAIGFNPADVPTIPAAARRGVGPERLDEVRTVGADLAEVRVRFEPAGFEPKRWRALAKSYYRLRARSVTPLHLAERCRQCGRCQAVCPVECLERKGDRMIVGKACIRCYACHENCEHGAMLLKCPWWLKPLFRGRAEGLDVGKLR